MKSLSLNKFRIKITGLNLHNVLDFFEREKIYPQKIKRPNQTTLICTLKQRQYNFFLNHPLSRAFKVEVLKETGINKTVRFLAVHIGTILALMVLFAVCLTSQNKIYNVVIKQENHVCQNENLCIFKKENLEKLTQKLDEYGIKNGNAIPNQKTLKDTEKAIVMDFEQISGANIQIKGRNIFIDIVESKLTEDKCSENLVAPVSGIIISSYVTSGNCLVKNGDIVTKGQTLVKTVDDNKIVAEFEIRTFYHENIIYDQNQVRYEKTGKTYTQNNISLWKINLTNTVKPNYKFYQTTENFYYQSVNMILPIKIKSTCFYELKEIVQDVPFSDVEENLKQSLYEKTLTLTDKNATIRNHTFATYTEGSRTRLDCYIEAIYKLSA